MGNTQTRHLSFTKQQQDLTFYTQTYDPKFSDIQIYTSKKMPLCYILKLRRTINDSKVFNLFRKIQNCQSASLVSLYGFQIIRQKCCQNIIREIAISYWEYYNLYFSEYLRNRMHTFSPFVQSQFWHIVQICCEASSLLSKNNCFYDFSPKTMVITPQGKLKIVWAHLMSQNRHLKYFKYFQNYQIQPDYYSPQQLQLINSKQLTNKLNFQKCSSFGVGMLLLSCLTLTDLLKTCYSYDMSRINIKAIDNIIDTKIVPHYSQNIYNLLRELLKIDPKKRINLSKIHEKYQHFMNDAYQLRICCKKQKKSQKYQLFQHLNNNQSYMSDSKTIKVTPITNNY